MLRFRLPLVLLALVLMAGIGVDLWLRANPAHRYAQAIAQGFNTPPALDTDAALDERLSGDANEAGYRWAERRGLDRLALARRWPWRFVGVARPMCGTRLASRAIAKHAKPPAAEG
jgi:hypothetical protein